MPNDYQAQKKGIRIGRGMNAIILFCGIPGTILCMLFGWFEIGRSLIAVVFMMIGMYVLRLGMENLKKEIAAEEQKATDILRDCIDGGEFAKPDSLN